MAEYHQFKSTRVLYAKSTQGIHTFSVLSNISIIKGGNSPGISSRRCRTRSAPEKNKFDHYT